MQIRRYIKTKHVFLAITLTFTMPLASLSREVAHGSWNSFEKQIDQLRIQKKIPGLAISVVVDGELFGAAGYGYSDRNREVPITPETPFWIASISKTFVGLAYLHLQDQGKVDLNELAAKTPKFTGLCEWLASTTIPFAVNLDCKSDITIANILHHQVNGVPGTQFLYNPIMYSRLSRHLEHRLGAGVDKVEGRHIYLGIAIDKTILEPAGMTRTMSSMWDRDKMGIFFDMADGFGVDEKGNRTKLARPDRHIAGGAGVVSTVLDLAKYDIAITKGKIASGDVLKQLLEPAKFNDSSEAPYGYGWYFQCYKGERLMWHGGWDAEAGYSSLLLRVPERKLSFAILANSEAVYWGNPLDIAEVETSEFASLFLDEFVFNDRNKPIQSSCSRTGAPN